MATHSDLIVSVSGIRGIVGQGLTPGVTVAFAQALGTYLQGGKVLVSRDSRPSGQMLFHAVSAGLMSTGCDVVDLGIQPTPTVGLAVQILQAAGAIQISASHNPSPWNGLKLFGGDGAVLNAQRGKELKDLFDRGAFHQADWQGQGGSSRNDQSAKWHCDRVLELVDVPALKKRRFKVLLDANGGAGGPLGRMLLESLGCDATVLGEASDGHFAHSPEPIAENLTSVLPLVKQHRAEIGFVLDPDADRLALLDETGRYIGEELTLALAVQSRLSREPGPVAINMSSSRVTEDLAIRFGTVCHRSAVGEANVVEMMRSQNATLGGEGNGGVIDPRVGWVRDPFIGMGLILELLAHTGKKLSELVADLPHYAIVKDKYTVSRDHLPAVFEMLTKRWPEAKVNRVDGLRLDWANQWLHVRGSNTEPIIRAIAEAPSEAEAKALCTEVAAMIREL